MTREGGGWGAGGGGRERYSSFAQLVNVRLKEFLREPEAIFWSFVFPILLATGLAIAFRNRPAEVIRVGVVAVAPGAADSIVARLRSAPGFAVDRLADDSAARTAMRTGRVAVVAVPSSPARIEYRFDDTRPEARMARLAVDDAIQRGAGRADLVGVTERRVREPGSRYIDFLVPGLLGMNIMGGGMWSIGFSIVESRRKRLLKRLVATPMSRVEYLASYILTRLVFLVGEAVILVGIAALAFGVPVRGSIVQLALIAVAASLAFSGLGLLVSSRVRTIEAVSGLMNFAMLPMWVLSGIFFSASNYPAAFQPFIQALPLTAVNDALRANMLQGLGWQAVLPELGIIAAWLAVSFVLALKLFRWR
ncbi:MAG: ABC transporter permease [Gemmatimonadaceae bacterium]